ncbi:hypothetical protein WJ06_10115 [Burkholderia cepacia]|nr:hypothetical protein WJ06_10115 [Burkholderia cepacia]
MLSQAMHPLDVVAHSLRSLSAGVNDLYDAPGSTQNQRVLARDHANSVIGFRLLFVGMWWRCMVHDRILC